MAEDVATRMVERAPESVISLILIAAFGLFAVVIIVKSFVSDETEFLWWKWRRDKALRDLLRQAEQEVAKLSGLIPLFNLLNGELADVMREVMERPLAAPERISAQYRMVLSGLVQVLRAGGYHRAAILFPESAGSRVVLKLSWTLNYSTGAQANLEFDTKSIPGRVYTNGELYYCRDTKEDPLFIPNPKSTHSFRSFVCVPIRTSRSTLGVLQVDAVQPNAFTNDDISTLYVFAKYAAVLRRLQFLLNCDLEEVVPGEAQHGTAD